MSTDTKTPDPFAFDDNGRLIPSKDAEELMARLNYTKQCMDGLVGTTQAMTDKSGINDDARRALDTVAADLYVTFQGFGVAMMLITSMGQHIDLKE